MAARRRMDDPLEVRVDRFLQFDPDPDWTPGTTAMQFFDLWREAEGARMPPINAARLLLSFFPDVWSRWGRTLLDRDIIIDDLGNQYFDLSLFITTFAAHWTQNVHYPHPAPLEPAPLVPDIPYHAYRDIPVVTSSVAPTIDLTYSPVRTTQPPPPSTSPPPIPPPPGFWHPVPTTAAPITLPPSVPMWDQSYPPTGTHDHEAGPSTTHRTRRTAVRDFSIMPSPPRTVPSRQQRTARMSVAPNRGSPFRFTIPSPLASDYDTSGEAGERDEDTESSSSAHYRSPRSPRYSPSDSGGSASRDYGSWSAGGGDYDDYLSS